MPAYPGCPGKKPLNKCSSSSSSYSQNDKNTFTHTAYAQRQLCILATYSVKRCIDKPLHGQSPVTSCMHHPVPAAFAHVRLFHPGNSTNSSTLQNNQLRVKLPEMCSILHTTTYGNNLNNATQPSTPF